EPPRRRLGIARAKPVDALDDPRSRRTDLRNSRIARCSAGARVTDGLPALRALEWTHFPRFPRLDGTRIRAVADPAVEGRSLVMEAIRTLAIACRGWAGYPADHPNVTQAGDAAQTRGSETLAAHGAGAHGGREKPL